jgi:hypothetical protein
MRLIPAPLAQPSRSSQRSAETFPLEGVTRAPVSNGLRDMLPPLLLQFVTPVLKLCFDDFNVAGLFDGLGLDVRGIRFAQFGGRQLRH